MSSRYTKTVETFQPLLNALSFDKTKRREQIMHYNQSMIAGNLGRDVEVRHTTGGKAVADLSVAISRGKDKDPIWTKITVWEKTAEYMADAKKGDNVIAIGVRYDVDEYEKDGEKKKTHYFVADSWSRVTFIPKRSYVEKFDSAGAELDEMPNDGSDDLPF